jgi:peptidoglycan hydrolase CwlO-like protein
MKKMLFIVCMIALGFLFALATFDNTSAESAESESVKAELEQLKADLVKAKGEKDNLNAKVAVEQRNREQLQEKIDELASSRKQLQKLVEKFTFTCDQSRQQLEEIIDSRDKLKKQVVELSSSRDKLQRQYAELVTSHNQLRKQVEKLVELRDEAVAQAQTAQKRIEVLVAALDSERQKYREQQDRLTVTNQAQGYKQPVRIATREYPPAATVKRPVVAPSQVDGRPICQSFSTTRPWIMPGQTSTLSWQVSNADRISIEPDIGLVSALGSRAVDPSKTTTYTLIAANRNGESIEKCKVEVSRSLIISSDRIPPRILLKADQTTSENKVLSEQQSLESEQGKTLGKFLGYRARKDESGKFIFIPVFESQKEE